jgi:hypothetical protein
MKRAVDWNPELEHVQVRSLDSIFPAPDNDVIYRAIALDDPEIIELARSIKEHGLLDSLLISQDGFIISGHRRRIASLRAGLKEVPVKIYPISRKKSPDEFRRHESAIKMDPKAAHRQILNDRQEKQKRGRESLSMIDPDYVGRRCKLSKAKMPLINAIIRILNEHLEFWPLFDRQIHFRLLGSLAPLIHASKPNSRYVNDMKSYRAVTDVLTRGRIEGVIPWEAIDDDTRPIDLNQFYNNPAEFVRQDLESFLKGYWRNRQQSQPNHIEIVIEKLTVRSILEQVSSEYTLPVSTIRGMGTTVPKKKLADRFLRSQKRKLTLLVVSDLDPAGDAIAVDLVKSFKRDFGINDIEAFKVALTMEQVTHFSLQPSMEAKPKSPTYSTYVERYGTTNAYELEAMEPADLIATLRGAINSVMDIDLYNQECAAEESDSSQIIAVRQQAEHFFRSMDLS